jgi:hypothetical protein
MQNKANFRKARINVNYYMQKDCENEPRLCRPEKQSQTKPIFRRQKTEVYPPVAGQKTDDGRQSWMNRKMVVILEKLVRIIYKDRTFDKQKGFYKLRSSR